MKLWRGQPDHNHWRSPFSAKEHAAVWWGLGIVSLAMGASTWTNPGGPPFMGKWSWLYGLAYQSFGPKGPALLYITIAGLLAVAGLMAWRRK